MQMRHDVAAQGKMATEGVKYLRLKMMLCVMMLPLVVVGCTTAACQSVREATIASGVDNAASPHLADTKLNGIISPQRELITAKTTGRNPERY